LLLLARDRTLRTEAVGWHRRLRKLRKLRSLSLLSNLHSLPKTHGT